MTPLTDVEILDMADAVRGLKDPDQCCHGLINTKKWLLENRGQIDPTILGWLKMQHVACDCEVANHLARSIRQKREPAFE